MMFKRISLCLSVSRIVQQVEKSGVDFCEILERDWH